MNELESWYEPKTPEQIMSDAINLYDIEKIYVLFSGGKDSVCVVDFVATNYPDKFAGCVFTNVGLGAIETRKFVINYCKEKGWKLWLTWADNRKRFIDILLSHGWATPGSHRIWMGFLKFHTWYYFLKYRKQLGEKCCFVSGVRKKESMQRNKIKKYTRLPVDINAGMIFIKPFLYKNGVQLWDYFIDKELKKTPVYEWLNRSGECYCGAFTEEWDLKMLQKYDPLAFETIRYYEKLIMQNGTDAAKRHSKWGSKSNTKDVINQQQLESFFGNEVNIEVNDDYCGESCQIE
jgi:3'-phosphoadenosine 5'-phosphosulfate sulfotransferase (PAPS reductase)/FAD synthetase